MMQGTIPSSRVKFLPGHRHLIDCFVKEAKQLIDEEKKKDNRKRHSEALNITVKKKRVSHSSEDKPRAASSSSDEVGSCSMASLVEDIRQQVAKWQRRQKVNEKLRDLKEHDQYEALVKKDGRGYTASIQCKLCEKNIVLSLKGKKTLISNWTRHVALSPSVVGLQVWGNSKPSS